MVNVNLTQACLIQRQHEGGLDELGNPTGGYTEQKDYPCHLSKVTRSAADVIAMADRGRVYYTLQLPYDADIEDGDTVVIDNENYETVQVYRTQTVDVMRQALVVKAGA